jgi:hypothetical protein
MPIRGSCLCGAVTFEIDQAVGPVELCHCNRCRKVSGSGALASIGVRKEHYRFLTGREFVRVYDAPILHDPPPYQSIFCSACGCPVPPPDPPAEHFEIAAGLFDDDPGVTPDRHIFVELTPAWDDTCDNLPRLTLRDLHHLRTGEELPRNFRIRTHRDAPVPAPRPGPG